jgi:hypothetical protein
MKRIVALFFLLIPSILTLGHAVIPHYYDHTLSAHQNCKTDEHNSSEFCLLSQVYVKISKEEQLIQPVEFNFNVFPCLLFLFPVNSVAKITDLNCLPFRQKPYLLFYHITYISHSIGLRAPPVC